MRDLIRSLAKHATVILSSHILQEVQAICGPIIIHNGKKVLDTTMDELLASKPLLVAVDADPEHALDLFNSIEGVAAVEPMAQQGAGQRYALDLENLYDPAETAPIVTSQIAMEGWKHYALQTERHDLEKIFSEISTQGTSPPTAGGWR